MYEIAIISAALMALILFKLLLNTESGKLIQSVKDGINGRDYGVLSSKLVKSGLIEKISPPTYRLLQCIIGIFTFAIALSNGCSIVICAGISILFILLPGYLVKAQIKKENQKMLSDIEHLYNLLHLQRQAGAFFIDSLIDAYRVVSYWRLKKALIDLVGGINGKKTVREATEEFANKFDNPYITSLADIIRHGVEDGNNAVMLADVSDQLLAIQQAQYIREQGKQDLKNILLLTALFAGILAAFSYLAIGVLGNSMESLFY